MEPHDEGKFNDPGIFSERITDRSSHALATYFASVPLCPTVPYGSYGCGKVGDANFLKRVAFSMDAL